MRESSNSNSKQIVKNTIVLYTRMIVVMLITLYSSRIVLEALGINDFGLYNVVGGVVALLSFLKTSLTSSTQRFLSYEIGRKDLNRLKAVFGNCMTAHVLISVVIFVIAETIGLWFLNAKINIPEGREFAANVIFHLSVLSTVINMITVPFNAAVISHEKMSFFAVVSVGEAVLKLFFAFMLITIGFDKLIVYGVFVALTTLSVFIAYLLFCRNIFEETKFRFSYDKRMFIDIFGFSSWTILGQMAVIGVNYGTGVLINMFYSVSANAAMGVAQQVNGAITGLTSNFQTAFQPQITKSYASKDYSYMSSLICYSSKISFFLLFIVSLPLMLNIDFVLDIWLTIVPEYSNSFCVLLMIASIFNALSSPLWISIFATGRIRNYQIAVSLVFFSDLIIVYFLFELGLPPVSCMMVKALVNFVVIFVRLLYARNIVEGFSAKRYIQYALFPCIISAAITLVTVVPLFLLTSTLIQRIIVTLFSILFSILVAYYVGLKQNERNAIRKLVMNMVNKNK